MKKNPELPPELQLGELEPLARRPLLAEEPIRVGDYELSALETLEIFSGLVKPERLATLQGVVSERSLGVVPVLENIYDRGNISAVMRSSEAHGFFRMHIVEAENTKFKAANRVTKGSEKWLDVRLHRTPAACVRELREHGYQIYATHLEASKPIEEVDFSKPTAVVLGNEKDGVSPEMLKLCDGNFIIPMVGFSQSFNISVAAALTLYHAYRVRCERLGRSGDLSEKQRQALLAGYLVRCFDNPLEIVRRWRQK